MGLFAQQPFKGAYALSAIAFELVCMPFWLAKYFLASGRQIPSYTFRQALAVRVFYSFVYHASACQIVTPLPLTPGKEKEKFVLLKPAPDSYYKGPLLSEYVKPVEIGATWYPAPLSAVPDLSNATVILHFHGGAYVVGDGRTEATGYLATNLLKGTPATHVFAPQYRLSTLPASKTSDPFPAALQDCLSSYLYLINTLGISPKNIIISGDSAGANAAIAILRYISEYGSDLGIPAPSAALLWSPWIDLMAAFTGDFVRTHAEFGSDYISHAFTRWGCLAYAGLAGTSIFSNPYVTSLQKPFKTTVPLWANAGSAEVLYSDVKRFTDMMEKEGNDITLDVTEGVPHDIILVGNTLGFDTQTRAQVKRAGEWVRGLNR
ncbi:alpha/beta-hydrolase [Pleomassaria siparia CBS 279.74]|uniref:Alpha/beta-hydrolase n=1 Tax=Pleomassaria siparia CBS 279.74 TaxID=1314801 RepID=A0A6G1KLR0_9PLEO|nr:alpha/beta-hydrolase [Pleomassaria siparia CBS 279.74]